MRLPFEGDRVLACLDPGERSFAKRRRLKAPAEARGCGASRRSPLWFRPWRLSAMWLGGLASPPPRSRASSTIRRR